MGEQLHSTVSSRLTTLIPTMRVVPQDAPRGPSLATLVSRNGSVLSVFGCVYLIFTTVASTWYLVQLNPYFANDLWWINYTVSGHQALVIDIFNTMLTIQSAGAIDLFASSMVMDKAYDDPQPTTEIYPMYGRRLVVHELSSVEYAIENVRSLRDTWYIFMSTQYCWVDFDHTFELAHTAARQTRCFDRYSANGAVSFESVLRNQNWDEFTPYFRGKINVTILASLEHLPQGQKWIAATSRAFRSTSVDQEAAYWRAHGVGYFQLQWQNSIQTGVSETISLQNAFGLSHEIVVKNISQVQEALVPSAMHGNIGIDMLLLQFRNRSLVRSATNSFTQPPVYDFEAKFGLQDSHGNYVNQIGVFRTTVGPFLAVDLVHVAVPPPLLKLYNTFQLAFRATPSYLNIRGDAVVTCLPTPPAWFDPDFVFYGGNPMCLNGDPLPYIQDTFGFYDKCDKQVPLSVTVNTYSAMFSIMMMGKGADPTRICSLQSSSPGCQKFLQQMVETATEVASLAFDLTPPLVALSRNAIDDVNISIMQYATNQDGTNWTLLHQPLLDDSAWTFYGWVLLYDWIQGRREVVSFEGDLTSLVLISTAESPMLYPSNSDPILSISRLIYYLVVYTVIALGVLAVCCMGSSALLRFQINASNFFWFNRIAGFIWVGRPLLLLRSVAALLVLSTSQVAVTEPMPGHSRLEFVPRSMLQSMVIAGEATWFLYVVQDFLTIVVNRFTKVYGPLSCVLGWSALVAMDAIWPVKPVALISRECTSVNMYQFVQCSSGSFEIGSLHRLNDQLIVLGSANVVAAFVGRMYMQHGLETPKTRSPPTRHLLGVADMYLVHRMQSESNSEWWALDNVSCLMAGLVPLMWGSSHFTFDIKRWVLRQDEHDTATTKCFSFQNSHRNYTSGAQVSYKRDDPSKTTYRFFKKHGITTVGLMYVMNTIFGSVSYLQVSQVNLANDLFWVGFNTTGAHAFITNWLNQQLVLGVNKQDAINMNLDSINLPGSYAMAPAFLTPAANYGALLQYSELSTIEATVVGLRRTDGCLVPWIFTQYCFVDFNQQWEMANSASRQNRCLNMTSNGAVFLESVLRNVHFAEFDNCWGPSFGVSIGNDLRQSTKGQTWLAAVASDAKLPVAEEVARWQSSGIVYFKTQWQNFKRVGLVNHYSIWNAFGTAYPFDLQYQNTNFRLSKQTTYKLYWGLANDFIAGMDNSSDMGGRSLVRSSAHYAFQNTSMETVLGQNGTLSFPLANIFTIMTDEVGPFGSVDLRFVGCPVEVKWVIRYILDNLRAIRSQDSTIQRAYSNISDPRASFWPVPKAWTDVDFISFGGSPLCSESAIGFGLPVSFGLFPLMSWDSQCNSLTLALVGDSIESLITSVILANMSQSNSDDIATTCAQNPSYVDICTLSLNQTIDFVATYMSSVPAEVMPRAQRATMAIQSLNVELIQFGQVDDDSPLVLYHINVLDPTEVGFSLFAWMFLFDWAIGNREAVAIEGDNGALVVLTEYLDPVQLKIVLAEAPTVFALYFRSTILYVTLAVIALASLMLLFTVLSRGHIEFSNLFQLQRVGASVWCGRPLLLVRSLTAVALLSTSSLQLVNSGTLSYFQGTNEPWFKTVLAANEVTWMVAIVNDIAVGVTHEYTRYYAFTNTLLVWSITVTLSFASPVRPTLTIDKQCELAQVDFQVDCTSGALAIGHVSRLGLILFVVVGCNAMCYVGARAILRHPFRNKVDSIFIYAGARYLFVTSRWVYNDVYYMDRMSAVLNGILTIRWGRTIHCLDVKLWRAFHVDVSTELDIPLHHPLATPARHALPLNVNQS
ncbi:Aste57867_8092 [Aphanomyces stellatus]|uniref:Aste57867_8092 protein n=1 Tax=Aphanomyces stellatus TaxID=120398 RepID=A0A485KJB9_9STRA|nr:hypothetical protein As57867_008062 [Aphanomyces stellatus]VFT84981.1 Aste57867_8092 [Aphanomyces stellatus]